MLYLALFFFLFFLSEKINELLPPFLSKLEDPSSQQGTRRMFLFKAALPQDPGASQNWNFENGEVEKHPGNWVRGTFAPTPSFPCCSGPAGQGRSRLPRLPSTRRARGPRRLHRAPLRVARTLPRGRGAGAAVSKCPPLASWPVRSTPRSSETVSASLLPPRLVTRELLNPGGLHCFSPKSGRLSFTKKLRQGLPKLCRRQPCRVSGGEHTPACTRAQVHLSGRAHGQGACHLGNCSGRIKVAGSRRRGRAAPVGHPKRISKWAWERGWKMVILNTHTGASVHLPHTEQFSPKGAHF